ncbi:MAG: hypothetical protein ACI4R5_07060, partial [Acetatifactor sp.]
MMNFGIQPLGTPSQESYYSATGNISNQSQKAPAEECQTCKKRKYQDGSDEMVSFKSAAHISPESAGTAVRAHEQEHVRNAY